MYFTSKAVGDYLLFLVEGKSGLLFKTKRGLRFALGIHAVVGWINGSMITTFTASADFESRISKRWERTDT
jgi:hypothetical protein